MKIKLMMALAAAICVTTSVYSQGIVGKLKQKASNAAEKALDKKIDKKTGNVGNNNQSGQEVNDQPANSSNRPSNKGGGGLVSTPPDVMANLSDADASYKSGSYGEARYAVQQAMLGVELEIGQKVLKSLPENVSGLQKEDSRDQVTSTGWGWAGLTIQREYNKDDQQLRATVANNSAWMSSVNMYLANTGYAQQTNGEQSWKQVKVKNHKAVIEYDESTGYKLSVPLGQSSLIVWEGVNFASEQDMMNAANAFDIDGIKLMLGEQ
ncbi:MAG TPA: hypothetical protein VD927_09725 [Chryseosolibacter sp.]|nr:hypothetical protein [Chryseosolibacter sp.]